jgi:hypothetical protein
MSPRANRLTRLPLESSALQFMAELAACRYYSKAGGSRSVLAEQETHAQTKVGAGPFVPRSIDSFTRRPLISAAAARRFPR